MRVEYETDPDAIVHESFRRIRELTELDHLDPVQQQVAMRVVHSLGQPEIASSLRFGDGACERGREALARDCPILCDVEMVKNGVSRRLVSAPPLCFLNDSEVPKLARVRGETRTMGLYGQELITITAAIARMNLVIHGVSDFQISSGNTLAAPAFAQGDKLRTFDVVLANPPYSIKKWNRGAWEKDPWGRNFLGTPPQGRADYAFFQHILQSMDPETGRCAILFPHGVLFRNEEAEMRRNLIEADLVECVLGLGPGLFYNSPMEACVIVCRSRKPAERQGRILFIDAVAEIARERAQSFLRDAHQARILAAYQAFADEPGFAAVVSTADVLAAEGNLAIARYVKKQKPAVAAEDAVTLAAAWGAFDAEGREFWTGMDALVDMLDGLAPAEDADA